MALPSSSIREVVNVHLFGLALALPLAPVVLERAHQFLLLRVHRDHRLPALLESLDLGVDVLELRIAVRVRRALQGLAVALQAVAGLIQQTAPPPGH